MASGWEAAFESASADSDDEFHDRLAEIYREYSPSRRRRLAEGAADSADHAQGAQALSLCGDSFFGEGGYSPSGSFSPSGQLVGEVGILPAVSPYLSQVHMHNPCRMLFAPVPDPCPPPSAPPTIPEGLLRDRRASQDSIDGIYAVDLALREGEFKQSTGGSTRQPSSPGSEVAPEDAQDSDQHVDSLSFSMAHPLVSSEKRVSNASSASVARAESAAPEAPNDWSEGATTVMVRQLPRHYTHIMFLQEVANRGFKGLFDFIYFPYDLKKGCNVGFGFVNLTTPEYALAFLKAFDGIYLDEQMKGKGKPLRIHPASVQGYEENRCYFSQTKTAQKRDARFSPLFLPGGSWEFLDESIAAQLHGNRWPEAKGGVQPTPVQPPQVPPLPLQAYHQQAAPYTSCQAFKAQVLQADAGSIYWGPQFMEAGFSSQCLNTGMDAASLSAFHAGSFFATPEMQGMENQWSTLEEEKQILLQELASVREEQRVLANGHPTSADPQPPVPR